MGNLEFRSLSFREGVGLIKIFTVEEVKVAVSDYDSYKCPGPDGISFGFSKEFWDILKDDLMRFLREFHRNGKYSKGINSTFISLIPKVDSPQHLNDFCPISLVGSMYKILAKVLANRLRSVIGSVISDSQSALIKGRQILDGILVANEIVDEAHRQKRSCYFLRLILKRRTTLLIGVIYKR